MIVPLVGTLALFAAYGCSGGDQRSDAPLLGDVEAGADVSAPVCIDEDHDGFGRNCPKGLDCDDHDDSVTDECFRCASPGTSGCPCTTAGDSADCGKLVVESGGYITCSVGHAACDGKKWGECVADRFVIKGQGSKSLGGGGATRPLYTSLPCPNPCDPSPKCGGFQGTYDDVDAGDAGGVHKTPGGGVTLDPGDGGDAGPGGVCKGLQCNVVACGGDGGVTTTLSGTVFDPAGKNPLYNVNVYIPTDPTTPLPAFTKGVTCDTCSGADAINAVAFATTDPAGRFTMTNVPSGSNIPIVVQSGKWRREIVLTTVKPCVDNTVANNCTAADKSLCTLRLPRHRTDGYSPTSGQYDAADLPQIAMVSGSADPLECMLMKAGISTSEVGSYDVNPNAKLHFFHSYQAPGSKLDAHYGNQVDSRVLWADGSPSTVSAGHYGYYDVVLDACEGATYDKRSLGNPVGARDPYRNLIDYTGLGGRAFLTHYSYVWVEYPSYKSYVAPPENWSSVASWISRTGTTATQDPLRASIVTSGFTKGQAFSRWLDTVGASVSAGSNQIDLHEAREDLTTVGPTTQAWMNAKNTRPPSGVSGNFVPHFTFNAPYSAAPADQCGRVVFSDFHVSADALTNKSKSTCYEDGDCGHGQSCTGSPGVAGKCNEPCASNADCADSTYSCVGATAGKCLPKTCTPGGFTCTIGSCHDDTTCWCNADSQCPSGKCVDQGQCAGGACTGLGPADGQSCEPDANRACTSSDAYTCTNLKFSCTKGSGGCDGVVTGAISPPAGVCSDASKKCNAVKTACVCTSDSQCAGHGATAKCVNVESQCTGSCTGSGTNFDANYCQIPAPLPAPTPAGWVCPNPSLGCDSSNNCEICTDDTQCNGSGKCVRVSKGWFSWTCSTAACTGSSPRDQINCEENGGSLGQTPTKYYTCAIGTCNVGWFSNSCVCTDATQCGAYGSCNASGGDAFGCSRGGPPITITKAACEAAGHKYQGGIYPCVCKNDAACGVGSRCKPNQWGSDGFGCTSRDSTDCTTNYSCSVGKPNSSNNVCLCTSDDQCGSGQCAKWSGCPGGACTGASGSGDTDGCVTSCASKPKSCSIGAVSSDGSKCWCTSNDQCASGKCRSWSGCTGSNGNGGSQCVSSGSYQAADHCIAPTTYSDTCGATTCSGGTVLQGSSCWCTNDNQCPTGACVPWSSGGKGCTGPNCTGTGAFDTNHCGAQPTCSGSKSWACPSGSSGTCDSLHNCKCAADSDCSGGRKCVNWSGCAAGACTGTGTADKLGCALPAPIPAACTPSSYTCPSPATCDPSNTYCWCTSDNQCASGQCVGWSGCAAGACSGTGAADNAHCVPSNIDDCKSDGDCGFSGNNVEFCAASGGSATPGLGQCQCSSSTNCGPGMTCVGGVCTGCTKNSQCKDRTYTATCDGAAGAVAGQCCATWNGSVCGKSDKLFPQACQQSEMTDQEKALEFMFFDLTACVTPDQAPPGPPAVKLEPRTFPLDFAASCPSGTNVVWRELRYQATFPSPASGSSIEFQAQTGPEGWTSPSELVPATPLPLVKASTSTVVPGEDVVLLDTWPGGTGLFTTASPRLISQAALRLWVTMTPTADLGRSPTLDTWKVVYSCTPSL